ncbi:MAG TPA: ABC transporter permease [Candidatus Angelobacter sp.]|jgi:predicted permease|nr:ABC transporter permease [Candidatus Angelobacter sp.]
MQGFFQDLRYALRQVRSAPGFALVAVLSLALGIGATTAVFSIVYAVLLHPYPFRDWERLVTLSVRDQAGSIRCCIAVTGAQLQQLGEARSIEEIVGFDQRNLTITGGDLPEDVRAIYWTSNAISYFGVPPALGRGILPSDAPEGQDPQPVAMLSYLFWQRHFGGNASILGQDIQLDHNNYKILGVMSPFITWGDGDVYLPLKLTRDSSARLGTSLRLKPGVSTEAASAELQPLFDAFARETPANFPRGFRAAIRPLSYGIATSLGPSLYLLFGAVCLLLLVGCLNVSILLMARGAKRHYELAIRTAMGAARSRIVRQLLSESLVLALGGELLGIALAYAMQRILVQQLPRYLAARQASIHLNFPVLSFSMALVLLTVIAFGLLPALHISRREPGESMQSGSSKIKGSRGKHTRNVLIAGQLALSLLLLASAATSIRAFQRLMHTDLGYDPSNTAALGIPVHENSYNTWEARSAYFDRLLQKVASTPDVTGATLAIFAVPPSNGWNAAFEVLGQTTLGDQEVRANFVGESYFSVLHVRLLQGRLWDRTESLRAAHVAVINQTMAHRYWANGEALGKRIRLPQLIASPPAQLSAPGSDQWMEIVGVVGDPLNDGLRNPVKPAVYLPYTFRMPMFTQILVRSRANPLALLRTFRAQVQTVDSEQQITNNTSSLQEWIAQQDDWQREHMVALLFGAFSVITLLLAGVGLYSVVSYTVAQRTNEFALRMALGAQRSDVLLQVLLSTVAVVGIGVAAGLGMYLLVQRIVAQWAYAPNDPIVLVLVTPPLVCIAILACYLPARRAMSLDPMKALRHE